MQTALLRKLAPLALLAVPFLVPVIVNQSDASTIVIPSAALNVAFGTSLGSNAAQTVTLFPNARIGRVFWGTPKATLPSLPSSYQIWLSFNVSPTTVAAGKFNAQFALLLQAWNKSGRTVYWDWEHEADNPRKGFTPTEIRAGWAQLLSVEKKYPSSKVKSMSIYEGYLLAPSQPHGNPDSWYVNADVLGFDCYIPANVVRAMDYAKSKGKPWAIPEFGNHDGDLGDKAYVTQTILSWAPYRPIGAAWYNNTAAANFSQPLVQIPQTTTYLRALAST